MLRASSRCRGVFIASSSSSSARASSITDASTRVDALSSPASSTNAIGFVRARGVRSASDTAGASASVASSGARAIALGRGARAIAPGRDVASAARGFASAAANAGNVYDIDDDAVATLLPEISSVKALTAAFTFANQTKGAAERGDGKRGAKTAARRLMARASDDALQEAITSHRRVDVRGSRGSGKSVALARLVMRARADGWVVAYVPDGLELTRLSYFSKSTKEGCDGLWETPDCAMRLLQHIANAANESVLKSVKVKGVTLKDENAPKKSRGKKSKDAADAPEADAKPKASAEMNLFDYAKAGSTDPEIAVDCALVVLNELRALAKNDDGKVMFVVDQYNALFGPSDMHEVTGPRSRKNIPAKSLRLARAVIETVDSACDEDARHVAVTAASHSVGVSKSNTEQSLPDELGSSTVVTVETPRFNTDEIATILREYKAAGIVKAVVDEQTVAAMKALTNGNPREIQSIASTLLR